MIDADLDNSNTFKIAVSSDEEPGKKRLTNTARDIYDTTRQNGSKVSMKRKRSGFDETAVK